MAFFLTQTRTASNSAFNLARILCFKPKAQAAGSRLNTHAATLHRQTATLPLNRGKYVSSTLYLKSLLPNTAGNLCRSFVLCAGNHNRLFRKCDNPLAKLLWARRFDSLNQQHTDTAQTPASLYAGLFTAFSRIWMQSGLLLRQQKLLNSLPQLLSLHQLSGLPLKQSAPYESNTAVRAVTAAESTSPLALSLLSEPVTSAFNAADLVLLGAANFFFDVLLVENTGYTTFWNAGHTLDLFDDEFGTFLQNSYSFFYFKGAETSFNLLAIDFYRYIRFVYTNDAILQTGSVSGDIYVKGRNFLISKTSQYRNAPLRGSPSRISLQRQDLFWELLSFCFNSCILFKAITPLHGLGLTRNFSNTAKFVNANFNFVTAVSLFFCKPLVSVSPSSYLPSGYTNNFFNLFCINIGASLMFGASAESNTTLTAGSFTSYLGLISSKLPQVFQIKFYMLNRRLRKIMKNSRRYRRIFSYIRPSKRANVLGRYIRAFFKFTKQRAYA
jgi:hypothetical protein